MQPSKLLASLALGAAALATALLASGCAHGPQHGRPSAALQHAAPGADPQDAATQRVRDTDPMRDLRRGVKGLRLGRFPLSERDGVDAEVLAAYDRSVQALAEQGAEIVDVVLPVRLVARGSGEIPGPLA